MSEVAAAAIERHKLTDVEEQWFAKLCDIRGGTWHGLRNLFVLHPTVRADIPNDDHAQERNTMLRRIVEENWKNNDPTFTKYGIRQQLFSLLISVGIITPSTISDWEVDRVDAAKNALGITSFKALENCVAITSNARNHLHKGPGNGALVKELKQANKTCDQHFEEMGVGDRLYFTITDILRQHVISLDAVKPAVQEEVIRILSLALQTSLGQYWYRDTQSPGSVLRERHLVRNINLNVLYSFLKHPRTWLMQTLRKNEHGEWRCLTSEEFEGDKDVPVSNEALMILLQYLGCSEDDLAAPLLATKKTELAAMKAHLQKLQGQATPVWKEEDRRLLSLWLQNQISLPSIDAIDRNRADIIQLLQERIENLAKLIEQINPTDWKATFARWRRKALRIVAYNPLKQMILTSLIPRKSKQAQAIGLSSDGSDIRKLGDVFTGEFIEWIDVRGSRSSDMQHFHELESVYGPNEEADLQRQPVLDMQHFTQSLFTNLNRHFEQRSMGVITAIRSDSHEDDATFEQDMNQTIALLAPGGIFMTDGHRASYSRVDRTPEVIRALARDPAAKCRGHVVVDPKTRKHQSIVIERQSEDGSWPTENDEWKTVLQSNVELKPLADTWQKRDDLHLQTHVRRTIASSLKATHGTLDGFRHLIRREEGRRTIDLLEVQARRAIRRIRAWESCSEVAQRAIFAKTLDHFCPTFDTSNILHLWELCQKKDYYSVRSSLYTLLKDNRHSEIDTYMCELAESKHNQTPDNELVTELVLQKLQDRTHELMQDHEGFEDFTVDFGTTIPRSIREPLAQ